MCDEAAECTLFVVWVLCDFLDVMARVTLQRICASHIPEEDDFRHLATTLFVRVEFVVLEIHIEIAQRWCWECTKATLHIFTLKEAARWRAQLMKRPRKAKARDLQPSLPCQLLTAILIADCVLEILTTRVKRLQELINRVDPNQPEVLLLAARDPSDDRDIALLTPDAVTGEFPIAPRAEFNRLGIGRETCATLLPGQLN